MLQGFSNEWKTDVLRMNSNPVSALIEELSDNRLQDIVKNNADKIIQYGQIIGYKCAEDKLKYSQLRRYVDEIKNIEQSENRIAKLKLFRIHLLHGYSRQAKELESFYKFIDGIIKSSTVEDEKDFEAFVHLIDSITAHFEAFRSDN